MRGPTKASPLSHLLLCFVCALGCTQSQPAEAPRAVRAALTFPPTPQGVDAPVFGPDLSATRPRAAFDGENFLVVWEDGRGARSDVVAARVSAGGVVLDPENLLLPMATG